MIHNTQYKVHCDFVYRKYPFSSIDNCPIHSMCVGLPLDLLHFSRFVYYMYGNYKLENDKLIHRNSQLKKKLY